MPTQSWLCTNAPQLAYKYAPTSSGCESPTATSKDVAKEIKQAEGKIEIPIMDTNDSIYSKLMNQASPIMSVQGVPIGLQDLVSTKGYASGGSTSGCIIPGVSNLSNCSAFDMSQYLPKFGPSGAPISTISTKQHKFTPVSPLQQMAPISPLGNLTGLAKGGLPSKYQDAAPKGHNPEFITGVTGYYACGGGTGQSDDIPAMLHDGDYVMDAETVSALGDGSSKAGAHILEHFRNQLPHEQVPDGDVVPAKIADGEFVLPETFVTELGNGDNKLGAKLLDQMRKELREHKRSAPYSKIPPKAKAPFDYIKRIKG